MAVCASTNNGLIVHVPNAKPKSHKATLIAQSAPTKPTVSHSILRLHSDDLPVSKLTLPFNSLYYVWKAKQKVLLKSPNS